MRGENGSVVLGLGLIVFGLMVLGAVGAVGAGVAGYVQASGAADAAALAAAPVTFRQFSATGTPTQEAARFASANQASLVLCACPLDRSWSERTVTVVVKRDIDLPLLGVISLRATSRATFNPAALLVP